ncbi:MAG TPA: 1-deoxy-D-xylulose-5-phosphate synthase [Planctomycetota bacterium]|nr:1-deoxy-D-xylulose-5-phosphate synthase [Planctomycetota bacterium]
MGPILSRINEPADLQGLGLAELEQLALEVREEIGRVVAANGGHLASNLGTVELTIALHRCLDLAKDALVWDVEHQAYTHKLLTGRRERFSTLRKQGGLSGFPNRDESPYDLFTTGHAGTAISSAVGLVCADALCGRQRRVVAVVGDGSLTNGVALEALNHAGALGKNLLVVLNDNSMSISKTVGGISQYLDRFRSAPFYNRAKVEIRRFVRRLPGIGGAAETALGHLKEGIKVAVGSETLFDQIGFRMFGPVDGHRIADLIEMLEAVRDLPGPILLHVMTQKGRGHAEAVSNPSRFHSAGPTHPTACLVEPEPGSAAAAPSYTSVFSEALCRLAVERPDIVAITAAMEDGTGLADFARQFTGRFFDVGICEEHAVALAGGVSTAGCKPVVAIYSTFLQRAYDQVFHDLCLQRAAGVVCMDRAGLVGADGPTHHGLYDIAFLRHLPGIILAAPRDGAELGRMLAMAVADNRLWAIRFPRSSVPSCDWLDEPHLEVGQGEVLREGSEAALVAYGSMVAPAWEAAALLAKDGIEVAVINARFAKPLDATLLASVAARVPVLFTLEEHSVLGGFGSAVLESLAAHGAIPCRVEMVGVPDRFIEHGSREALLDALDLSARGIAARVREAVHACPLRRPGVTRVRELVGKPGLVGT